VGTTSAESVATSSDGSSKLLSSGTGSSAAVGSSSMTDSACGTGSSAATGCSGVKSSSALGSSVGSSRVGSMAGSSVATASIELSEELSEVVAGSLTDCSEAIGVENSVSVTGSSAGDSGVTTGSSSSSSVTTIKISSETGSYGFQKSLTLRNNPPPCTAADPARLTMMNRLRVLACLSRC
jgi:hypothetical protein